MHLLHLFEELHHLLLLQLLVVGDLDLVVVIVSKVGPGERAHINIAPSPWLDHHLVYGLVGSFDDLDSFAFALDLHANQHEDQAEQQEENSCSDNY